MTWGAIAIGGATLVGGLLASDASKSAANTQADAANNAAALQDAQFQQTRADYAPYRQAGAAGLQKLSTLLGLSSANPELNDYNRMTAAQRSQAWLAILARQNGDVAQAQKEFTARGAVGGPGYADLFPQQAGSTDAQYGSLLKDFTGADLASEPGYQFGLSEGTKALERSAAARGGLYSGATLKGLQRYGTDYAGTKYNEAYNRDLTSKQSKYNFLAGITGTGQTATGQVASLGAANAANQGNLITSGGAARAAGIVGQSNAINATIGSLGNQYLDYQTLQWLRSRGGNV